MGRLSTTECTYLPTLTRSQNRRHRASAQSHDATMQRAHSSRCHARHTSSAITPPWGTLSMLPPRVTGTGPQAEQRTRQRTGAATQEGGRVWERAPTQLASLAVENRGPPHPVRPHTVARWQPAGQRRHRPSRSPAHAMAHLTGRRRAQHTRRPKVPPRRHLPLPRPTPPVPGPPALCTPTPTAEPRAKICRLWRRPAQRPRGTCRPRHKPNRRPSGTTRHQLDRRYGPQNRHLPVARPPIGPGPRPGTHHRPRGPQAREAGPGRRPCQKARPERRRADGRRSHAACADNPATTQGAHDGRHRGNGGTSTADRNTTTSRET